MNLPSIPDISNQSNDLLQIAKSASGIGIWVWNVISDLLTWDQSMLELHGLALHAPVGFDAWLALVHCDDRVDVSKKILNTLNYEENFDMNYRIIWPDNSIHYIRSHGTVVKNSQNVPTHIVGTNWDITKSRKERSEIEALSLLDSLTKLPNRRLMSDRLKQVILQSHRTSQYAAFLFIDIDKFKDVNNKYGHLTGDALIIEISRRLERCVRQSDTVARYAGDEFVIIFSQLGEDYVLANTELHKISTQILSSLANPYLIPTWNRNYRKIEVEIHCTASIGATLFVDTLIDQDAIIASSDAAMYFSKNAGGNQFKINKLSSSESVDSTHLDIKIQQLKEGGNNHSQNNFPTPAILTREIEDDGIDYLLSIVMNRENGIFKTEVRIRKYIELILIRLNKMKAYVDELNELSADIFSRVAPLYGIGKIAIPKLILNKSNSLSEFELNIIKVHTEIGSKILRANIKTSGITNKYITTAIEIVSHHHEKWDGTGYPNGLSGKSIPISARIITLIDVYEALVSERPYKTSINHELAIEEIRKNSGSALDPLIVDAFLAEEKFFNEIYTEHISA